MLKKKLFAKKKKILLSVFTHGLSLVVALGVGALMAQGNIEEMIMVYILSVLIVYPAVSNIGWFLVEKVLGEKSKISSRSREKVFEFAFGGILLYLMLLLPIILGFIGGLVGTWPVIGVFIVSFGISIGLNAIIYFYIKLFGLFD